MLGSANMGMISQSNMNEYINYPNLIIRKGFGTFSTLDIIFDAFFEIIHYPQKTIITTLIAEKYVGIPLYNAQDEEWELKGITNDNFPVYANKLFRINISGNRLTLFSFTNLHFGHDTNLKITHAEFPLTGIYIKNFEFELNGWYISCTGDQENLSEIQTASNNWALQLEGNLLVLRNLCATKEQYLSKANNITSLLSLALGNDVIFNRQLYYQDINLVVEEWHRKVDYHFGAEQCIPDHKISGFINETLTNFENWHEERKRLYLSTVTYINSSSKGYLEDRLLGISIAWESLAQNWYIKKSESKNDDLKPLKDCLKRTINDFELPPNQNKDFLVDRILRSIDWEKNTKTLQLFSEQYALNHEKMRLDFYSLNKIRNEIAHTGLFRNEYTKDFLTDLLYNHKFGLQVVLLLELGYNGLIETQENKLRKFVKMKELINNKPNQ